MDARNFTRKARIAGFSALGLGVVLALSACNASGSSAGAAATGTAAAPQASAADGQSLVLATCRGKAVVKPTTYVLECFDAINTLTDLRWTTWGQTATATELSN